MRRFCYNGAVFQGSRSETIPMARSLKILLVGITFGLAATVACAQQPEMRTASGDRLLIQRVKQEQGMNLPRRGLTMAQVERRYGAPVRKLAARGGDTKHHPVINRWEYSDYIVYFEHNHVIHSVLNTPAGNNTHPATMR